MWWCRDLGCRYVVLGKHREHLVCADATNNLNYLIPHFSRFVICEWLKELNTYVPRGGLTAQFAQATDLSAHYTTHYPKLVLTILV